MIAYDSSATLGFVPDGGPEIEHGGERLPLLMSGRATYRSVERSAAPKTGEIVYHEYALGRPARDLRVPRRRGVWEVSEGRAIDAARDRDPRA